MRRRANQELYEQDKERRAREQLTRRLGVVNNIKLGLEFRFEEFQFEKIEHVDAASKVVQVGFGSPLASRPN